MIYMSLGARLQQTYASEAMIISIAPSPPRGDKDNWPETLVKKSSMEIERGWQAVSAFIIICSARVHWFLRPLNAMRY